MNVVSNTQQLEQRIADFFTLSDEHKKARVLLDTLACSCPAWIFGGMVRDLGLFGVEGFSSDLDIVIGRSHEELFRTLAELPVKQLRFNKFGGIRFRYHDFEFDIWNLNETWAFREKLIFCEDESSLLNTTLMSWDAVLYDLRSEKIISKDNYLTDLNRRHLELVLHTNPNPSGSVTKILRTIFTKQVKSLGPELCHFLHHELTKKRYEVWHHYDVLHYQSSSFSRSQFNALINLLAQQSRFADLKLSNYK
ncbi:hypothetical protein ACR240_002921 [Escherichia coli]